MMDRIPIKNLYIHIGSHKTGSTYLQKYFQDNGALLSLNGILYPKAGCGNLFGHHDLYSGIKADDKLYSGMIRNINDEVSGEFDSVLLSSENFEYLTQPEINRLVGSFECENIKIIYYYRTWGPLLYAMWQEEIKHGSVVTFDSYAIKHITFPFASSLLNYSIPLQRYADVVGKENLLVANYETAKSKDLLSVMLKQINVDLVLQDNMQSSELNASFDPFLVEVIRMMNVYAKKDKCMPTYKPKHYYINHACKGKKGMSRHEEIIGFMDEHKVQSVRFNESYAFRLLLTDFISRFGDCFVDEIKIPGDLLKMDVKTFFSISPNYLCQSSVADMLYSAWSDIKQFCVE